MCTVAQVNAVLKAMKVEERIYNGDGYFYFYDGDAVTWPSASIPIHSLGCVSVEWVIREYFYLKEAK